MLSVAKLARGREGYYLSTVASGRDEAGGLVEPDGRWLGRAAALLGLVGTVDGPALRALLEGVDPATGELLSAHHHRVRVAAYDCTYSTPKSVSLLHALGPEQVRSQVCAGHEEAAAAALGYLERRGARVRRPLRRGEAPAAVPAGGFAAAAFLHRTSRAPDPHLHTHVLVANLAPGPDGRWSALDGRGLYLELLAARDLYETQLRSELTCRLGVSWRELQGAWADLAGINPRVNRAFSRRSAEIATALEKTGHSGPRAARIAAVRTRPEKDLATPYHELVSQWRERSYQLGVSDSRLASLVGRHVDSHPPPAEAEQWAEQALGEHGVMAREGTFRRGDLVRSRCASLPSGAAIVDVEQEVENLLAGGHVVTMEPALWLTGRRLQGSAGGSIPGGVAEPLYTTQAILALHERLRHVVSEHPGAVELLAYRPGGRLAALDAMGALASRSDAPVVAVAPGRAAAASFESVTGIDTVAFAGGRPAPLAGSGAGVVVVAEAQRLGPWELSSTLDASVATGGRVVILAPAAALETQASPAAILATHLAPFRLEAKSLGRTTGLGEAVMGERHRFCGREVVLVEDGAAARDAMLAVWQREGASGRRPLLVASDDAVVGALRDAVGGAGGSPGDVVEARESASRILGHEGQVVVLGVLPAGLRSMPPEACVQVAIAPPRGSVAERLGRAAELARPRYLLVELGPVRAAASDRSAWRSGAAAIETYRLRWSIDDPEQALGGRQGTRALGAEALGDLARTRREVREAVRGIGRSTPARERLNGLDGPGRSGLNAR